MRVVLDSNVIFSAFLFGGAPGTILNSAFKKEISVISSPVLLEELMEALRKKSPVSEEKLTSFEKKLKRFVKLVYPREEIDACRDPDDNRVLEAAVEGRCDFIVTGDKDLLEFGKYKDIKIVSATDFASWTKPK